MMGWTTRDSGGFGNGAGSYLRDVTLYHMNYEVNDPTWARAAW